VGVGGTSVSVYVERRAGIAPRRGVSEKLGPSVTKKGPELGGPKKRGEGKR